ncbi:MAG: FAD:protein FMN transferase [Bryobacteraceae bacterium]|nr:FAD:protein FMN transferase [Bryobacteraceae bacterium]
MKHFVVLLCLAPLVARGGEELRLSSSLDAMGTTFTVVAYDEDRQKLEASVDQVFEEVRRLDSLLSNYKKDSEWSRINREASSRPVRISAELYRLLEQCVGYSRASDGAFDITVGPLVKTWGFYKGSGRLPHRAEIRQALARTGYKGIRLDPAEQSVRFDRPGMEIDPGGIGKGYAVDRMVEGLRSNGIRSAMITAGGSSIYAIGAPPAQEGWKVKIRHPRSPGKTIEEIALRDESMSTSGSSEKFFVAGGKVYSHIFDPRTGYPATGTLSVSVVAPRTIDSEAWTKPFFIRGREWAARRKPAGFRVYICEDKVERACEWLP